MSDSRRLKEVAMTRRDFLAKAGSVAAGLTLGSLVRPAWGQTRLAGSTLKLGAVFPLTGPFAEWGKKDRVALEMAIDEISIGGGIGGLAVDHMLHDSGGRPPEAAALIRRLANDDRVLAILGPFSSSECEVAFPVGVQLKVPMIAQASSKPGVAAVNRPWAFRMNVDEGRMAFPAVKFWAKHYNIKTAAVIHDIKDAVGQTLGTQVLPTVAKANGVTIVNEGNFVTFTTQDLDFSAQVTRLRGMRFDGLIFGGTYVDATNFIREARRQRLRQPMVGGNPLLHENFAKSAGEAGEGVVAPSPWNPSLPDQRVQSFVRRFGIRAQAAGLPTTPEMVNVNVYETVYLLKSIIERRGVTNRPEDLARDRERIMQGLTETTNFQGLAGKFGFNRDGDGVKDIYVMMVKGGRWVQVDFAPA